MGGRRAVSSLVALALVVAVAALVSLGVAAGARASSTRDTPPLPVAPAGVLPAVNGDVDCDGDVDPVDALKVMRWSAALSVIQTQPCPLIGTAVPGPPNLWGDVDCSGTVNSIDALKLLRFTVAIPVFQTEPCPDIGAAE
jgi:hypothetical protein